MTQKQPSKLELAILSLLWEQGDMKARAVLEALPDGKERAYTSVLSVLQAMERKGQVRHSREQNVNVYHAVVKRQKTLGHTLHEMVRDLFGGSPTAAVQQLLQESDLSEKELCAMEALLAEHRSKQHKSV